MPVDPVDLINTPDHLLVWYRCANCGTRQERDRRLPVGSTCEACGASLTASGQFQYARLHIRLLASAFDAILGAVPYYMFGFDYATFGFGAVGRESADYNHVRRIGLLVAFLVILLFQLVGTSPGKLAMGIRVVDARAWRRPGPLTATMRAAGVFLTIATAGLGYVALVLDPERRTRHDRLAGTRVIQN